jgi:hypothetical protein
MQPDWGTVPNHGWHTTDLECFTNMGYLSDLVDYSSSSQHECFTNVGVFPYILLADGETYGFTHGRGIRV